MPNWCENILTVSGPVEDVDRFMKAAKVEGDEYDLSLNALCPIPDDEQANWYNWCVRHWGTKWDVDSKITYITENDGVKTVTYTFDSAWSPPIELFSDAINGGDSLFDNLYVHLAYAESGMGFIGEAEGDIETGFAEWTEECHDYKDFAYRAESVGFEGKIEQYHQYQAEMEV
jgi:hypothetical protein